jgi:DmsE family decaheme c-type cytochrome
MSLKINTVASLLGALSLLAVCAYAQEPSTASQGYVGQDACVGCHQDLAAAFARNIHSKGAKYKEGFVGCEACHGPGAAHASSGDPSLIRNPAKMKPKESAEICTGCHTDGKLSLWPNSVHETRSVSCTTCHSVHHGFDRLLKQEKPMEVCFGCHANVRAEMWKTSHHPIREGKMDCISCHNPHGSMTEGLISAQTVNDKCYECHAEKRGPFLYEHKPVTENCLTCHTPHGSAHNKLMLRKSIYLCQSCHSNSRHPGTLYAINPATPGTNTYQKLGNRAIYRDCLNCHANIHGSNHPSGKTFLR